MTTPARSMWPAFPIIEASCARSCRSPSRGHWASWCSPPCSVWSAALGFGSPALRHARESTRMPLCGNHLRQLATAFVHYTNDNKRFLGTGGGDIPLSTAPWIDCTSGYHFDGAVGNVTTGVLYPYVRAKPVYRCPSTDGKDPPAQALCSDLFLLHGPVVVGSSCGGH